MVGSTTWLSDLFVAESLLPPKARTLHYPPPSTTETSTFIISITNYTGRAREDIRKMITAIGARYTPELTYRNTHLICAVPKGPKYNKATEWNVAVVNHLWLEETYAKWKVQSVTKAEYVNFPPNLVEIVGDTPVTEDAIRKFLDAQDKGSSGVGLGGGAGSMVGTTVSQTMEHRLSARGRGENRNSQPQARNVLPVDGAEDVPVVHVSLEASGVHASGAVEDSQIAGLRKHPRIVREVLEGERRMSQFSDQVLVASGRPSIVPAELNSPAERSQAGPMGSPGSPLPLVASKGVKRRASSDLESDRDKRRSRESPEPNENRLKDHASPQSTSTRRSPGRTFILAFTGSKPSEKQIKGIKSLGGSIADKVSACTHLIANKVTRTEKMLLAVSMGIPILTMGWIDASLEAGHFIAPESYALQDESSEKQHGYRLAQSLERSRSKKLLAGWHVYVTPNSKPEAETTRTLVEASGGKVCGEADPLR